MREQKELAPVVSVYHALLRAQQAQEEAEQMLSDPELRELAQEELHSARAEQEHLCEELKLLLLPRDPNDEKNVILEVRAGIGGEEGALFAADLLRMYSLYAERSGWTLSLVSCNETELGGVKEAVATVEGAGAWSRLKFEAGTHRVQRVPQTEVLRPHPDERGDRRRHARGRGGGRVHHRPEGSADRHLPLLRRGRPARQQDRERHPHHAPAHRDGGGVSGRAQPV